MKIRVTILIGSVCLLVQSAAHGQTRWDKFQQKLEDLRPKGKLLQQIKDEIEGISTAEQKKAPVPTTHPPAKNASQVLQNGARQVPVQQASRKSILNSSRTLPTAGVVLGIQLDPKFLPSQKLIVTEVSANSPAGKAGLRSGDQIIAVGGNQTNSLKALDAVLASLNDGDQVVIEFVRNRKTQKALARFGTATERSAVAQQAQNVPGTIDVPAPPDLSEIPAISPNDQSTAGLRSVLSAPLSANPIGPSTRSGPVYFPSAMENPPVVGSGQYGSASATNAGGVTIEQLQEQVRQQQELIEQLSLQLQQYQSAPHSGDELIELDTIILDADGN